MSSSARVLVIGVWFLSSCARCASCDCQAPAAALETAPIEALLASRTDDGNVTARAIADAARSRATPHPPSWSSEAGLAEWQQALRTRLKNGVVLRPGTLERIPSIASVDHVTDDAAFTVRQISYDVLPGVTVTAHHYAPKKKGRAPGVVVFGGHDVPSSSSMGLASPERSTLCAHLARHGIHALHVPMLGRQAKDEVEDDHEVAAGLGLVGVPASEPLIAAAVAAPRVLAQLPGVDAGKLGVAGLSGGGFSALWTAALDPRIAFGASVAGFAPSASRLAAARNAGDTEQSPFGFYTHSDYDQVAALIAPRPFLFAYMADDDCCFSADSVLPSLRPTLDATGIDVPAADTPFQLDSSHARAPSPASLRSTTLDTMRALALKDAPATDDALRDRLREVLQLQTWSASVVRSADAPAAGVRAQFKELRLEPSGFLVRTVIFAPSEAPAARTVLMFSDDGRSTLASQVRTQLREQRRVVAFDPLWIGKAAPTRMEDLTQVAFGFGLSPLGDEASEVAALARTFAADGPVDVIAVGPRSSLIALVAAALEPDIARVEAWDSIESLISTVENDVWFPTSPELFAPGLLRVAEVRDIARLVSPRPVVIHSVKWRAITRTPRSLLRRVISTARARRRRRQAQRLYAQLAVQPGETRHGRFIATSGA